jgi:replicative DNA helicase
VTVPNRTDRRRSDNRRRDSGRPQHLAPAPQPTATVDPVEQAERAVLGGMLQSVRAIDDAVERITSAHFRNPANATIFRTIIAHYAGEQPTEPLAITISLGEQGELARVGGAGYIHGLLEANPNPASTGWYAAKVARHAAIRQIGVLGLQLDQAAQNADPDRVGVLFDQVRDLVATNPLDGLADVVRPARVDEFLAAMSDEEEEHDWIIPGILERTDRVILTGAEGSGKSTFGRQVAVQVAAGIHPFTTEKIDPVRVLIVDLENSERQLRRELRPLVIKAGAALDPANLLIQVRLEGIDLHRAEDRTWLDKLVGKAKPDLVVTGPIYKMASGDPTEERHAKSVTEALDQLRTKHGCALWIEAHSAKAVAGVKRRPIEPYGASLWLRWPEFGIHLSTDGDIEHWRGQREHRDWPSLLLRGGAWPWTPSHNELELKWRQIKNARFAFEGPMSIRDIEAVTGISKSTVARVLKHYRAEWDVFNARNPGEGDV